MKKSKRSGAETSSPDEQNEASFSSPSAPRGIVVLIPTNKYDILISSDDYVGIKEALKKQ